MSGDGTLLNPGTGGDTIYDEVIAALAMKMAISKIRLGAQGVDGGDVSIGNPFPIMFGDSVSMSPFGRTKVSSAISVFNSQQQYGDDAYNWENLVAGGAPASPTFLPNESTIQLTTGTTASGASQIRQSRLYHRYVPAHGTTDAQTFVFDSGASIANNTRRVMFGDQFNACYLECVGTTINIVFRTYVTGSVVETRVAQALWNVDSFGAAGGVLNPSGITVDWTKSQIFLLDLQWLGAGRIRACLDINGVVWPFHEFNNANVRTTAYWTTANLPLRYECFNTGVAGGVATLRQICAAVQSGGGNEVGFGKLYGASTGATPIAISNGQTRPLISLRASTLGPNSVRNTGQITIGTYGVTIAGSNQLFWQLLYNPTAFTGAVFQRYSAITAFGNAPSIADIDVTATGVSGGYVIDSGFLNGSSSFKGSAQVNEGVKALVLAYSGLLDHQDVLTLVVTAPSGATTAFAAMQWTEAW